MDNTPINVIVGGKMKFLMNKDKDNNNRVAIQISKLIIQKRIAQKIMYINHNTNINGFRKGKIPFKIIEERYSKEIYSDVFETLMQKFFNKFIKEKKIKIIGFPKYEIHDNQNDNPEYFKYSVIYEKYPDFKLNDVKKIKVKKIFVSTNHEDIKKYLKIQKKYIYKWKVVSRPIQKNDKVTIDYSIYIHNKRIDKFDKKNFDIILIKNECIPILYNAIINKYNNDVFFCKIHFSAWHPEKTLQNKDVVLKIRIKNIKQKEKSKQLNNIKTSIPLLQETEYKKIKKNVDFTINRISNNYLQNQIVKSLIQQNPIIIPPLLLKEEIKNLYHQNLQQYQKKRDNILTPQYHQNICKEAEKRIHIRLIIQKIIKNKKLSPNPKNIQLLIKKIAQNSAQPLEMIHLYNTNPKLLEHIKSVELEMQTMQFLFNTVQITQENCTLDYALNNKWCDQ